MQQHGMLECSYIITSSLIPRLLPFVCAKLYFRNFLYSPSSSRPFLCLVTLKKLLVIVYIIHIIYKKRIRKQKINKFKNIEVKLICSKITAYLTQ